MDARDKDKVSVILAAGRGSRLKELSLEQPKPMIMINDVTIISNLVQQLIDNGVKRIVVLVGYMEEKLRAHLQPFASKTELIFVTNPVYDKTNNIYTLWLGREYLQNGFYLFEADVFLESSIVKDFLEAEHEDLMLVDRFSDTMNGTVIDFDNTMRVLGMYLNKDQQQPDFTLENKYKTVNFYKVSKAFVQNFFLNRLQQHIDSQDTGSYYELIIKEAVEMGLPFYAFETGNRKWFEIDTQADLQLAEQMFSKSNQTST